MVQLRLDLLIVCMAGWVFASTDLRATSINQVYDLRGNDTDAWDAAFYCSSPRKDFACLLKRETNWINEIKSDRRHNSFYINILKREYEVLSNTSSTVLPKKEYLSTPSTMFSLVKRTARDWPKVVRVMGSLPGIFNLLSSFENYPIMNRVFRSYLPVIVDLGTGFRALSRLQSVYNVTVTTVADLGTPSRDSALESLEGARYLCGKSSFLQCQQWLGKFNEKIRLSNDPDIPEEDYKELYFISHCMNGNGKISKMSYERLHQQDPTFNPSSKFNVFYEKIIRNGCEKVKEMSEKELLRRRKQLKPLKTKPNERFIAWEVKDENDPSLLELCNHRAVYAPTARLLKCRYVHYNNPYLRIGPFKMEELHIDPPVLVFHDVISDKEINAMVKFGKSRMYKATVYWDDGSEKVNFDLRTSAISWIEDWYVPTAKVLSRRTAMMTGWNLKLSQPNQLASYGPAGVFNPHIDAKSEENDKHNPLFGIYSVVMYYINDVAKGGHTIFPALNVSVAPEKGSAVLWFNIGPDGKADKASVHGGCPVLQGFKWVINKWFQKSTQDFPKCKNNKETSFRYFYL